MEQVNKVLAGAEEPRRSQYTALLCTGMRSGELQRLRVEDVDLEGNWIHVVSREGGETKTGHSRKIPIHARLRPVLAALLKRQATGGWLFTSAPTKRYPSGDHCISTKHLNDDFVAALTAAGVPAGRKKGGFSIHSLRNTFETVCVNAGIPQRVIDTWLGHRSDTSMASIYYRLSDEESQAFMRKVPFTTSEPPAESGEKKEESK